MSNQQAELRAELEHMFASAWQDGVHHLNPKYLRRDTLFTDRAIELISTYTNKQIEETLDRLDKSMPTDEQLTTKYGYHMPEKKYGYRLGLHDIRETIEAERKKL